MFKLLFSCKKTPFFAVVAKFVSLPDYLKGVVTDIHVGGNSLGFLGCSLLTRDLLHDLNITLAGL